MTTISTIRYFLMTTLTVVILYIGTGCAPLPDVSVLADHPHAQEPPKIVSAQGLLPPEKSKAIMERLQGEGGTTDLLQRHNAVLETMSGLPLTKGNKVTLLVDGKSTYAAMFKAIDNAADSINVETFKIDNDEMSRKFVDRLLKKQSEGVQVNFMYDSIGSRTTPVSFFNRLRDAGVQVVKVVSTHTDHRKMLIVDGKLVITGGINISRVYASTPFHSDEAEEPSPPWRDTDIEVQGPAVAEFQKLFMDMWSKQKGPNLPERKYFPKLRTEGNALVRAIGSTPGEKNRVTYISYLLALHFAVHSIYMTNAYFIPDDRTLDALTNAARRGVDVKIILPSVSDSSMALYAMRYNYSYLLKSGIKLYERRTALLHSKTAVIDDVWSTVGSTNLDFLSLSNNYEVNAVILSGDFAREMQKMFANDLAQSEPVRLEHWKKRSVLERMKELFAHMLSHLM